jgi:hypothetical protein
MTVPFAVQLAREESCEELIHKERLTVEEVCELFRFLPELVREAVWRGELRAIAVDHHIYYIRRDALLDWLRARAMD